MEDKPKIISGSPVRQKRKLKLPLAVAVAILIVAGGLGAWYYWTIMQDVQSAEANELTESKRELINEQAQDATELKQTEEEVATKGPQEQADFYATNANLAAANGEYTEAISGYSKALELQQDQDYTFYLNFGLAYELNGDKQLALETYTRAREIAQQADLEDKESVIAAIDMSIEAVK